MILTPEPEPQAPDNSGLDNSALDDHELDDHELDDHELLRRHSSGDTEAFGLLVQRHRDRLWAVALRTTGDPEEAADALQDAFVSAYRAAANFRGDSLVTTWLHRIVVNAALDRLRRQRNRTTVPLPESDLAPAEQRDPLAERETAAEVQAALATLPPEQRVCLVLVDIEGYPVDDAAAILGIPTGTVKSRCARGRARLVPLLAHLRNRPSSSPVESTTSTAREDTP